MPLRWDIRRFDSIDSTNAYLLGQAREGGAEGVVAVAEHQSAGRGRLGRAWVAPPGSSLLVSVLLRPDLPLDRLHLVTAAVALAAVDALAEVGGFRADVKWPNDLLVDGRKIAGVLAERDTAGGAVVVGIGVNVNWPDELPAELRGIAVAANHVAGCPVDKDAVLEHLLERLSARYGEWADVARDYRRSCATVGQTVRVDLGDETFTGTAVDVTDEGHLLVDVGVCIRTVAAGDVHHLRPL